MTLPNNYNELMDLAWEYKVPKNPRAVWRLRFERQWTQPSSKRIREIASTEFYFTQPDADARRTDLKKAGHKILSFRKYELAKG